MSNSNLIHCQNGHVFSKKRYGTVCPYCNVETATKEKRETQRSDVEIEEELFRDDVKPVCGWIVCIDGPRQGKDYQIVQGKNFVGRADDMDIQILGDNEISRRNHAVIVFDPKKKETVLLPGDSNGIVYLNGNAVEEPYTAEPTYLQESVTFPVTVPEGCLFVMGDNRNHSLDARFWVNTYVPKDKIIAKVLFSYFPKLKWIE